MLAVESPRILAMNAADHDHVLFVSEIGLQPEAIPEWCSMCSASARIDAAECSIGATKCCRPVVTE